METKNEIIRDRKLLIGLSFYPVASYTTKKTNHRFKCQQYGHIARVCKYKIEKCGNVDNYTLQKHAQKRFLILLIADQTKHARIMIAQRKLKL